MLIHTVNPLLDVERRKEYKVLWLGRHGDLGGIGLEKRHEQIVLHETLLSIKEQIKQNKHEKQHLKPNKN